MSSKLSFTTQEKGEADLSSYLSNCSSTVTFPWKTSLKVETAVADSTSGNPGDDSSSSPLSTSAEVSDGSLPSPDSTQDSAKAKVRPSSIPPRNVQLTPVISQAISDAPTLKSTQQNCVKPLQDPTVASTQPPAATMKVPARPVSPIVPDHHAQQLQTVPMSPLLQYPVQPMLQPMMTAPFNSLPLSPMLPSPVQDFVPPNYQAYNMPPPQLYTPQAMPVVHQMPIQLNQPQPVNWPAYLENISIKGIAGFSVIALESGPIPGYYTPPAFEGQNNNWTSLPSALPVDRRAVLPADCMHCKGGRKSCQVCAKIANAAVPPLVLPIQMIALYTHCEVFQASSTPFSSSLAFNFMNSTIQLVLASLCERFVKGYQKSPQTPILDTMIAYTEKMNFHGIVSKMQDVLHLLIANSEVAKAKCDLPTCSLIKFIVQELDFLHPTEEAKSISQLFVGLYRINVEKCRQYWPYIKYMSSASPFCVVGIFKFVNRGKKKNLVSIEEALRETFYCSRVRRGMSEEEICKRQFISIEQSPYILMIDVAGSHHLKISQFFELTDEMLSQTARKYLPSDAKSYQLHAVVYRVCKGSSDKVYYGSDVYNTHLNGWYRYLEGKCEEVSFTSVSTQVKRHRHSVIRLYYKRLCMIDHCVHALPCP